MAKFTQLLDLLIQYGGKIISTNNMTAPEIQMARDSGRIHIDENNLGFAWDPDLKDFPETDEQVEFFDKWYPMDNIEVPDGMFERIMEKLKEIPVNNTINCKLPGVEIVGCPMVFSDCKTCKFK